MSVSSVIRQGLGSTPSDLLRLGLGSGVAPSGQSEIITLGLLFSPSKIITLGLDMASSGAATISAATADPTGGITADIGCTTDTASGDLFALVRIGGSPAADTAIEAGGQTAAVSTTTPSIAYTGLTAATGYSVDIVQKVGGVYSNVITTTFTTDNTGSGGGNLAIEATTAEASASGVTALINATIQSGPGEATAGGVQAVIQEGEVILVAPGEATASGVAALINGTLQAGPGIATASGVSASIYGAAEIETVYLRSYITTQVALASAMPSSVNLASHI